MYAPLDNRLGADVPRYYGYRPLLPHVPPVVQVKRGSPIMKSTDPALANPLMPRVIMKPLPYPQTPLQELQAKIAVSANPLQPRITYKPLPYPSAPVPTGTKKQLANPLMLGDYGEDDEGLGLSLKKVVKKVTKAVAPVVKTVAKVAVAPIAAVAAPIVGTKTVDKATGNIFTDKELDIAKQAGTTAAVATGVFVGAPLVASAIAAAPTAAAMLATKAADVAGAVGGSAPVQAVQEIAKDIGGSISDTAQAIAKSPSGEWWVAQGGKLAQGGKVVANQLQKITKKGGRTLTEVINVPTQARSPQDQAIIDKAAAVIETQAKGEVTSNANVLMAGLNNPWAIGAMALLGLAAWNLSKAGHSPAYYGPPRYRGNGRRRRRSHRRSL